MHILLSSIVFLLTFISPNFAAAAYTTQVSAPGTIGVGNLIPETFLELRDSDYGVFRIEEKLSNPGFENDLLGYSSTGVVLSSYEMKYLGATIKEISPLLGTKMLSLPGDIFGISDTLAFTLNQKVSNLRLWIDMITNSNKLMSDSRVEILVNDSLYKIYDLGKANPESHSDGILRDSGFFAVDLNLRDQSLPIKIELRNQKDPDALIPDLTVLVDNLTTNIVTATDGSHFVINQTGRYLPAKKYDYGVGYLPGDEFLLNDGTFDLNFFGMDDFGHISATKSAHVGIFSSTLPPVDDLIYTPESSTTGILSFGYARNKEMIANISWGDQCSSLATASALLVMPIKAFGFMESITVPIADCFGIRIVDGFGNKSSFSTLSL
jgi:hypothetical protein